MNINALNLILSLFFINISTYRNIAYIKSPVRLLAVFSIIFLAPISVSASIWVDTEDVYLKTSIRALANGGIINVPVNTYPLMYKSLASDLNAAQNKQIPQHLQFALQHVQAAFKKSQQVITNTVKLKAMSETDDFQSFGERYFATGEVNLFNEIISDQWAYKGSIHLTKNAANNKKVSFEGSYLATYIGNWVISVDQVAQWWGPGQDSAIILSNNAVAFPAIRFTRKNSKTIDLPVLNWLGPISMTTYFGQQEHSNALKNIRTWGARVNFKPFKSLEIGLSRTAQWGGIGRPTDFSTFVSLLMGDDNVPADEGSNEPGNQLGGADFHWRSTLLGQNFAVYGEITGEDEAGGLPSNTIYQLGAEASFGSAAKINQVFVEYVNTFVDCNNDPTTGNCAYEHDIYKEGYRRYGRTMGSTYDSDSEVLTLGYSQLQQGGLNWYGKIKFIKLNKDNSNPSQGTHPISPLTETRLQLEAGYQQPMMIGLLNVEASLYQRKLIDDNRQDVSGSAKVSWEYRF